MALGLAYKHLALIKLNNHLTAITNTIQTLKKGKILTYIYIDKYASFLHAAGQFGFDLTFTGPSQLDPEDEFVGLARKSGSTVQIERDPVKAVKDADLVVTDTWVSMHDSQSTKERRHNMLRPYQVNEELMSHARPDALFMHCLPAHREDEATSAVMDGPHSVIWDEAENRLHAQKAIMRWCLGV